MTPREGFAYNIEGVIARLDDASSWSRSLLPALEGFEDSMNVEVARQAVCHANLALARVRQAFRLASEELK